jgi:hypothetical protein
MSLARDTGDCPGLVENLFLFADVLYYLYLHYLLFRLGKLLNSVLLAIS